MFYVLIVIWGPLMINNPPLVLPQRYATEEACQNAGRAVATLATSFTCVEGREVKP